MTFRLHLLARVLAALVLLGSAGELAAQPAAKPAAAKPAAPATKPAAVAAAKPAAAGPAKPAAPARNKLAPVETFALANGLSVAVLRTEVVPSVSVQLWYRAGSKDEPRDRRGLSQVLARAMWKGSKRVRPDAHAQLVAALGGQVNGGTDEDSTHFGDELPVGYLDFAIQLEAERMRGLQLRDSVIKAERENLANELRQEDNSPLARGLRRLLELAFTKHSYAWPAGGVAADLAAVSTDDVRRYYDTFYVPNNALLVVVGDVTVQAVRESAEKHFGTFAAAPIARAVTAETEPALTSQRRELAAPGQLGVVLIGYAVPPGKSADWAPLQLTAAILGSGEGSRIKQRLRAPGKEIGLDGGVTTQPREHPSLFIALAAFRDANGGPAVEAALLDEINKLAQKGPTKDELRVAKAQLQTRAGFALESNDNIASQIGRAWILSGDPKAFAGEVERLEAVKPEDVKRVITTYLRPERATILTVPPAAPKATKP